MKLELFVALRYLRARRKQAVISVITLISVLGVTAGVMALNIAVALNTGIQQEFQTRILGATSHVNLLRAGSGAINDYQPLANRLSSIPEVTAVSPTIYGQALLQSDLRQQHAFLKGIDSSRGKVISDLLAQLKEGSLKDFGTRQSLPSMILGKDLAESLGVLVGETVRVFGLEGELSPLGRMPRLKNFKVIAVFESGLWEYDANWALIPIPAAQHFFGLDFDEVSTLEFRIRDIYTASEMADLIQETAGVGFITNTWIELNRPLFSALRVEKIAIFIAIGLIVLVASLNIVSTLTLMVMEKNRDIAIITAMGGTSRTLMAIFMIQGLIIGLVGTLLGDLLGSVTVWYLDHYQVFKLEAQVYAIPYVPFQLEVSDLLVISALAIIISFVATLYPARSASRIDPVEALRYE